MRKEPYESGLAPWSKCSRWVLGSSGISVTWNCLPRRPGALCADDRREDCRRPPSAGGDLEAFFGNEMQNWCELSDMVVEVRDYRMRADRTPEYVMVNKAGPMKASHRSVTLHEAVEGGTRVTHRWDVEPHGIMRTSSI
jgi:hypothetical protein